ncbi:hypothetical protein AAHE18_12G132600 [Arachis hypogaea]|nr:uncharacterized protein DS421_12g372380 [Arachis hypogaea]
MARNNTIHALIILLMTGIIIYSAIAEFHDSVIPKKSWIHSHYIATSKGRKRNQPPREDLPARDPITKNKREAKLKKCLRNCELLYRNCPTDFNICATACYVRHSPKGFFA